MKVHTPGKMGGNTKGHGNKVKCMDMVNLHGLMAKNIRVSISCIVRKLYEWQKGWVR